MWWLSILVNCCILVGLTAFLRRNNLVKASGRKKEKPTVTDILHRPYLPIIYKKTTGTFTLAYSGGEREINIELYRKHDCIVLPSEKYKEPRIVPSFFISVEL
jgi:hypothetical protein